MKGWTLRAERLPLKPQTDGKAVPVQIHRNLLSCSYLWKICFFLNSSSLPPAPVYVSKIFDCETSQIFCWKRSVQHQPVYTSNTICKVNTTPNSPYRHMMPSSAKKRIYVGRFDSVGNFLQGFCGEQTHKPAHGSVTGVKWPWNCWQLHFLKGSPKSDINTFSPPETLGFHPRFFISGASNSVASFS